MELAPCAANSACQVEAKNENAHVSRFFLHTLKIWWLKMSGALHYGTPHNPGVDSAHTTPRI